MSASLLPLVKQGDPAAIAVLLNCSLQKYGVKSRVQRRGDRLHVLLEADFPPKPLPTIGFIRQGFARLAIAPIQAVTVYSRQKGDRLPIWQHTLLLQPLPPSAEAEGMAIAAHESSATLHRDSFSSDRPAYPIAPATDLLAASLAEAPVETPAETPAETPVKIQVDSSADIPELLKRPEAVIVLICFSLILFWDTYLALLEQVESHDAPRLQATRLSNGELARRLNTSRRVVREMKRRDMFSEWTRRLDPEGIAWAYRRGVYVPETVGQ
ncbi:MAG: hypothetical protein HY785_02100 [Oscillatoriophycideae cyanobacterium NC_groundwater_1537_Pr4_S-0.65um_50_18]|nr:hypothetical protein [Oscillatoriophycideae cyanobacterium NC_groundwater_1537_Pr4_S-0.65um_50_18]